MLSPLRNRFGIPGVISVIALVFAMLGGAYAASNNQSGKATASAKAKKGPRGPKGATGPAGAQGPAGPQGAPGAKGDAGANGAAGAAGAAGEKGATGAAGVKGATGAAGPTGPTGFSGFTDTLPSGKTETGTWSASQFDVRGTREFPTTISFPIPLPTTVKAVYLNAEETEGEAETGGCKWTQFDMSAKPEAPAGTLCVFTQIEIKSTGASGFWYFSTPNEPFEGVAGPTGVYLWLKAIGPESPELPPGSLYDMGVWAVTAP